MERQNKSFNQSMDETSKNVDAFATDLARVIKKHFGGKNSSGVGDEIALRFTDPTKEPMSMKDDKGHFTVMYPSSSGQGTGLKTVDANTIRIDFWDGSVRIGESVQSNGLTKSLQMTGQESINSLFIRVSKTCRLVIDGQGERIIAGDFAISGVPIKAIELTSVKLDAFDFSLIASTNSKARFDDESEEAPEMLLKELRVASSAGQSSLTPSVGKKIRVYAAQISMTITSNLTATLRALLTFGTGGASDTTKVLWSHRVDSAGESQIFIGSIKVIGAVNETVTLTNATYSAGACITRAVIYYREE